MDARSDDNLERTLFLTEVRLREARAVTAMLLNCDEIGLLIEGIAPMVAREHQEAAPLLRRLQAEYMRLRAIRNGVEPTPKSEFGI